LQWVVPLNVAVQSERTSKRGLVINFHYSLVAISGRDVIYGMVITMRLGAFVLSADFELRPSLSSVMSTQHFVLDV
jgi:hypothetical protein